MKHANDHSFKGWGVTLSLLIFGVVAPAVQAANAQDLKAANKARVVKHWTPDRMATATPRDLVIDSRGLGYLRRADGSLVPHGHQVAAEAGPRAKVPVAKPPGAGGGSADSTPPSITNMNPDGSTIAAAHTFSAMVTDASGVKSVSFVVRYPDGVNTQSFSPASGSGDSWSISLSGFTDGDWSWWVVAKDGAAKGGNSGSSTEVSFTVDTASSGGGDTGGGSGGSSTDTIINQEWTDGGSVQTAAGRIYFEMPSNRKRNRDWNGYVCSGSVVTDDTTGRSVILTAAHCVYDDAYKAFARNVLFIPNQAQTSGAGTDFNCGNDPLGCWVPAFGVVDNKWTRRTFPDNLEWDYAYYIVNDEQGNELDAIAGSLAASFTTPMADDGDPGAHSVDFSHALGYSYSDDPNFMYCAEDMTTEGTVNWWLPSCGLSGGASGGPWLQRMDVATGNGPVISVNSWGYTTSPGMAGPMLNTTSASCLFGEAKALAVPEDATIDGDAGVAVDYCR